MDSARSIEMFTASKVVMAGGIGDEHVELHRLDGGAEHGRLLL
jgi:hypothetical protein